MKQRGMFRSKATVSYMVYTVCLLMQICNEENLYTTLATLLTSKAARSPDALVLLKILGSELA